ncbi:hypothetical protein E4T42_07212 [Aureobasidium subglaciale]|nr:hypothetical protein E4T42_07212 [Aureobasidium subglaciale]
MAFLFASYLSTIIPAHFCNNSIQYSFFVSLGQGSSLLFSSASWYQTLAAKMAPMECQVPAGQWTNIYVMETHQNPLTRARGTANANVGCLVEKACKSPIISLFISSRCCFLLPLRLLCNPSATDASPKRKTVKSKRSTSCAVLCDRERLLNIALFASRL